MFETHAFQCQLVAMHCIFANLSLNSSQKSLQSTTEAEVQKNLEESSLYVLPYTALIIHNCFWLKEFLNIGRFKWPNKTAICNVSFKAILKIQPVYNSNFEQA